MSYNGIRIEGFIPARYESTRFPGKPLAMIGNKPMIMWVYNRAKQSSILDEVFVATDSRQIADSYLKLRG